MKHSTSIVDDVVTFYIIIKNFPSRLISTQGAKKQIQIHTVLIAYYVIFYAVFNTALFYYPSIIYGKP